MSVLPLTLDFPGSISSWKPGQWDLVTQIICSEKPYVVLEAPAGTGKSVVALAVARLLGAKTVILTGQRSLQDQYNTMLDIPTVRGRGNFPCLVEPGVKADAAVCTVGGSCDYKPSKADPFHGGCPYYDQKLAGQAAPVSVLNYAYWLAQVNYAGAFQKPDLLIADEAHTLEEELRRFATLTFQHAHFKRLGLKYPRAGEDLGKWQAWAAKFRTDAAREYAEAGKRRSHASHADRQYINAITTLYTNANALLDPALRDDGWTLRETLYGTEARPIWISPLTPRLFLRHTQKILFMSATILSADLFAHQLGIPPGLIEFIRTPCPFPKAARPIYYQPVGKISKDNPAAIDALVEAVDAILEKHPTDRGLIHTVSYKIAQIIMDRSRHWQRMVTHDTSGAKVGALTTFRRDPGSVLVSPSVTTGVDLPYDLCRFQVIAKLSFPDLGDPQIKKRMKLGPDGEPDPLSQQWYSWSTACDLVQAYGRGVRAEDDACVTYLLDGNWRWFRHTVRNMLPSWFTEAFVKTSSPDAMKIDDLFAKSPPKMASRY